MPTPPPSLGPGGTGPSGTLPGTEHTGVIFQEYVNVERKEGGSWTQIAANVPATFESLKTAARVDLEPWTHKPIYCLWLYPNAPLDDGDRLIRSDSSRWYVRGEPNPSRTHTLALVEASAEDGLFAARNPNEP